MLDIATIDYILNYYSRFMTLNEAAATKHHIASYKFRETLSNDADGEKASFLQQREWLANSKDVLSLLDCGYETFRSKTAERILNDNSDKIYFNKCPKCDRLARTPQAKQCRFCGYTWHKYVVATFQIASAFQVKDRAFFILGDILTGAIKTGMKVDLTTLGLAIKPTITDIEFARHTEDGIVWEDTGLGLLEISEEDKEFLKVKSPFLTPILIEDQNAS